MSKGKKQPRAGFIPYYVSDDGKVFVMFMKPSDGKYGGKQFQIAKGKIEDGEDAKTAAIREASEEIGLKEENLDNCRYFGTFLGYTELYYGRVKDKDDFGSTTHETEEAKWIEVEEFYKIGRPLHIPIIKAFCRDIIKWEPALQSPESEK